MAPIHANDDSQPRLSVVIVNYNTRDYLRACLQSLESVNDDLTLEVIVVDNASDDGSAAMVRDEFPAVLLIEPLRNTWFSGGNNLGIQAANGHAVLLLNPDTIVGDGLLTTLYTHLMAHPEIGAVTCRQQHPDDTLLHTGSRAPAYLDLLLEYTPLGWMLPLWRSARRARLWYATWDRNSDQPVELAPASCLMARREQLVALRGFDEAMRLYFTDDDLCHKIRDDGLGIQFLAAVTLLHYEKGGAARLSPRSQAVYFADLIAYTHKYHGIWAATLLTYLLLPTRVGMALAYRWRKVSA